VNHKITFKVTIIFANWPPYQPIFSIFVMCLTPYGSFSGGRARTSRPSCTGSTWRVYRWSPAHSPLPEVRWGSFDERLHSV